MERRDHVTLHRKRHPKLRQLDAKDVDAVFAESPGAVNSLRDVQVLVGKTSSQLSSGISVDPNITIAISTVFSFIESLSAQCFSAYVGTSKRAEP